MLDNCFICELHPSPIPTPPLVFVFETLYSSDWSEIHYGDQADPEFQRRTCRCLLGVGVKDIHHYTQLVVIFTNLSEEKAT